MKRSLHVSALAILLCGPGPGALAAKAGGKAPYAIHKLKNGLEVITLESEKVPLITVVLASKAGAMTETAEINGLTHLWEHMFFKGNKTLPNQEAFNQRIRQLGIVYNGDTSAEKVRYYFTLPSNFLEEGLQFMSDAISSPLLEENELKKERQVVMNEYDRFASQPGFDLGKIQDRIIYGDKAFQRDPLGNRKVIETATREQLLRIKREVFVPTNSALLIAGAFNTAKTLALVEKHFANWTDPKDWKPLPANEFKPFTESAEVIMTDKRAQNPQIQNTYAGPKVRANPKGSFAADVLINLLGARSGKYYKKFIDSGLTYSAGLSYHTQNQAGEITVFASCPPKNIKEVQKLLQSEISEWLKPDYFTEEQLQDVRRSLLVDYKRELNQPSAYIKSLAFWWAVTGLDYYGSYLDNLQATSLADVKAFIKEYLVKKPAVTTILLSPEAAVEAGLKDNSATYLKKFNLAAGA